MPLSHRLLSLLRTLPSRASRLTGSAARNLALLLMQIVDLVQQFSRFVIIVTLETGDSTPECADLM